jgi:mannosyltransferase OCH1-like enzyme
VVTNENNNIPKVIHYCWFGKQPLPTLVQKCIASWKKYLPEYKIIEWNENNFDINMMDYTREAYEAKKYAFVSDVARFYVLYNFGGIYMDTDVEVLKSLDVFLDDEAFSGFEDNLYVAPGLIYGSVKGNKVTLKLLEGYSNQKFLNQNGEFNIKTVCEYTTELLTDFGLNVKKSSEVQCLNDITIYPKTYFCPTNHSNLLTNYSKNTYTVHHYAASWTSKKNFWTKLSATIKLLIKQALKKFSVQ